MVLAPGSTAPIPPASLSALAETFGLPACLCFLLSLLACSSLGPRKPHASSPDQNLTTTSTTATTTTSHPASPPRLDPHSSAPTSGPALRHSLPSPLRRGLLPRCPGRALRCVADGCRRACHEVSGETEAASLSTKGARCSSPLPLAAGRRFLGRWRIARRCFLSPPFTRCRLPAAGTHSAGLIFT